MMLVNYLVYYQDRETKKFAVCEVQCLIDDIEQGKINLMLYWTKLGFKCCYVKFRSIVYFNGGTRWISYDKIIGI